MIKLPQVCMVLSLAFTLTNTMMAQGTCEQIHGYVVDEDGVRIRTVVTVSVTYENGNVDEFLPGSVDDSVESSDLGKFSIQAGQDANFYMGEQYSFSLESSLYEAKPQIRILENNCTVEPLKAVRRQDNVIEVEVKDDVSGALLEDVIIACRDDNLGRTDNQGYKMIRYEDIKFKNDKANLRFIKDGYSREVKEIDRRNHEGKLLEIELKANEIVEEYSSPPLPPVEKSNFFHNLKDLGWRKMRVHQKTMVVGGLSATLVALGRIIPDAKSIYRDYETVTIDAEFTRLYPAFSSRDAAYNDAERIRKDGVAILIAGGVSAVLGVASYGFWPRVSKDNNATLEFITAGNTAGLSLNIKF